MQDGDTGTLSDTQDGSVDTTPRVVLRDNCTLVESVRGVHTDGSPTFARGPTIEQNGGVVTYCTFTLNGVITVAFIADLICVIFQLVSKLRGPTIRIYLTSEGGDPLAVGLLSEYLRTLRKHHPNPPRIIMIAIGVVASTAVSVFLLGDERIATPGAQFVIHHCKVFHDGEPLNTEIAKDNGRALDAGIAENLGACTHCDSKQWLDAIGTELDIMVTEQQAVMIGLATRFVDF